MSDRVPYFIIIMLMVCCLVVGFTMHELLMPLPQANILNCPKANISVGCPKPDIHFDCPEFPEIPMCPDVDCGECQYVTNDYGSHLQKVISSVFLERSHAGIEEWDCDDMAEETVDRLDNAYGDILLCKQRFGYYYPQNNSSLKEGHSWVGCRTRTSKEIIIEATNGRIIPPEEYGWYRQW